MEENMFPERTPVTELNHKLNEIRQELAKVIVGQHQMVACRYAKFNKSKSNITSGGLGTMGFALPAAIGAASSHSTCAFPTGAGNDRACPPCGSA